MVCPNYSHIFDEISYSPEENMLNGSNHAWKSDTVLISADFCNGPLLFNDILNNFQKNISKESDLDVISYVIYPHNAFSSCEKLVH